MGITMRHLLGQLFLAAVCVVWPQITYAQTDSGSMFLPLTKGAARTAPPLRSDVHIVRSREMLLNWSKVASLGVLDHRVEIGSQTITLNLFDDVNFTAIGLEVTRNERGFTWYGALVGIPNSSIILTLSNGVLAGKIQTPTRKFSILNVRQNRYRIGEIDESLFPPDHRS